MSLFKIKQVETQSTLVRRGVVNFFLTGKEYAVDIGSVREIIYGRSISPLPGAPDYFEGLIDLRGTVIPVIHLGKRLGSYFPDKSPQESHILIVEIDRKKVGFIVDRVEDVVMIEKDAVQPAQNLIELPFPVIEGVFHCKDRLILLLHLEGLFTPAVLRQITEAMEQRVA
jgi:purine-binding chemotaxis protein CheW